MKALIDQLGAVSDDQLIVDAHEAMTDLVEALRGYACSCGVGECEVAEGGEPDRDNVACGFNAREAIVLVTMPAKQPAAPPAPQDQ